MKLRQASGDDSGDVDSLQPPSPPTRHEKWKQARIRPSGTWTSDESQRVAERIVSKFVFINVFLHIKGSNYICFLLVGFSS